MINRTTGEVYFRSGLRIVPHCPVQSLSANREGLPKTKSQSLSLPGWKRHVLGRHVSEHGEFEVEALSSDEDRIYIVFLAHVHPFYEPKTPADAERRAFHEGVISLDLAGQREFSWGEALCHLESAANKDWLIVAYRRETHVPLKDKELLWSLCARERLPDDPD